MPIPTCPTRCGDRTSSAGCNLDHSSLVACNHSYSPPKIFSNLSSMDVPDVLHDRNFKVAPSLASGYYSGSQVSNSMSGANLSKYSTSGIENLNKHGFKGFSGFFPVRCL